MASIEEIRDQDDDGGGADEAIPPNVGIDEVCDEELDVVADRVSDLPDTKESVIPALQEIQDEYGFLPTFAMEHVADKCGTSVADVYGTASFYSQFYLEPRGEHTIKICTGTACHVKGADELMDEFCEELDVEPEEVTDDGAFTVTDVRCIGACSLAPAVMVGDDVHGNVEESEVRDVIEQYRE
ncbi:MAG: NADH-quinone oxidoreductase subunit NuoE [Haloarculaceae archaeon]